MKLQIVSNAGAARGYAGYYIEPAKKRPTAADAKRLKKLMPRIKKMLERVVGKVTLNFDSAGGGRRKIWFALPAGTSKSEKKFELRSVFGWIELFDSE